MNNTLIIIFCLLVLIAYVFDLTAQKTKIPSVILLLFVGWGLRQGTSLTDWSVPNLDFLLPILGTVGLILIVLEGSLELELNRSKYGLIRVSLVGAVLVMVITTIILAIAFHSFSSFSWRDCISNAIPLAIMSSAIAIPSARNLKKQDREFITYESSLSDIAGVLLFNFIVLNETLNGWSFLYFGLDLLIILVVSFGATLGLSFLLGKIDHHVKYLPIIVLVILIYALSKIYHLPGLVFILVLGLFLGNLDELKHFKWMAKFHSVDFNKEVMKFKELTYEATFLVRSLFFLVFGFLIETSDIVNPDTLVWALGIVAVLFIIRMVQLKLSRLPMLPLLFIAPRGLITILLFLSIAPEKQLPFINQSLIIQVVLLTSFIMMFGLMGKAAGGNNSD